VLRATIQAFCLGVLVGPLSAPGIAWVYAQSPEPSPPKSGLSKPLDLTEQARQLVRQLDDRELTRRQDAERQLLELGPDILSILPPPTPRMSAEMRQRLARIVGELQSAAAMAVTRSTTVSLSGSHRVAAIFEAFQQQTGNEVAGILQPDRELEVMFSDTPYWSAMDHVLDQLALTVNPYGGRPNQLVLAARNPNERPRLGTALYQDAFRVEATRITSTRDLRNPELQGMRIALSVGWEPRLTPISFTQSSGSLTAEDEMGNALHAVGAPAVREVPVHPGMAAVEFEIPLALASPMATRLARLQGELNVLVPGGMETFEFAENLPRIRGVEMRRAGVTVSLEDVRRNLDLYQVHIRVRFDEAAGALESHRGWIFNNEAYLLDGNGKRIANAGLETTRQDKNEVGVAYLFDVPEGLDGHTFVYKTPALIVRHTIAFELKDLPLP
jgi:hypothetical protein